MIGSRANGLGIQECVYGIRLYRYSYYKSLWQVCSQ